jgi:hypothetical protein
MAHHVVNFEAGLFYGILKQEFKQLKEDKMFNRLDEIVIEKKMKILEEKYENTNFNNYKQFKSLQKMLILTNQYINKLKAKPRVFKDLTHLSNMN